MKINGLFLSIISLLVLSSCGKSSAPDIFKPSSSETSEDSSSGGETTSGGGESSSSSSSSSSSESSSEETPDESGVLAIGLDKRELYLELGKSHSYYPLVYFFDKNGEDIGESLTLDQKEVSFSSSNTSIITVNAIHGKPTAVALGSAYLTCTTANGKHTAKCLVHVVSSIESLTKEYQRVEKNNIDSLAPGDVLVFGCPTEGKTATSSVTAGDLVATNSTFSSDGKKITSLGSGTAEFMLDGSYNHWTLEIETELESGKFANKYLVAFNTNRVGFVNKTGNTEWEIGVDVEDNQLYIQSAANIAGWMMLNMDQNAFSLYTSNFDAPRMKLPDIYRLTIVNN